MLVDLCHLPYMYVFCVEMLNSKGYVAYEMNEYCVYTQFITTFFHYNMVYFMVATM